MKGWPFIALLLVAGCNDVPDKDRLISMGSCACELGGECPIIDEVPERLRAEHADCRSSGWFGQRAVCSYDLVGYPLGHLPNQRVSRWGRVTSQYRRLSGEKWCFEKKLGVQQ
jgi:hypothetical protein